MALDQASAGRKKSGFHLTPGAQKKAFLMNVSGTNAFTTQMGAVLGNFGGLELLSVSWVAALGMDEALVELAYEMPFGRRVELITRMIRDSKLPEFFVKASTKAWKSATAVSEKRNQVVHSSLLVQFAAGDDPDQGAAPQAIALVDLKAAYKGKSDLDGMRFTVAQLRQLVDEIKDVVVSLENLLDELVPAKEGQLAMHIQNAATTALPEPPTDDPNI